MAQSIDGCSNARGVNLAYYQAWGKGAWFYQAEVMLMFKDFHPTKTATSQRVVADDGKYVHCYITESLDDVLKRVNRFLGGMVVVNVETLHFPSTTVVSQAEYQTV
jgi:hypothetical protein